MQNVVEGSRGFERHRRMFLSKRRDVSVAACRPLGNRTLADFAELPQPDTSSARLSNYCSGKPALRSPSYQYFSASLR